MVPIILSLWALNVKPYDINSFLFIFFIKDNLDFKLNIGSSFKIFSSNSQWWLGHNIKILDGSTIATQSNK